MIGRCTEALSSELPPQEAPVMFAEKRKLFFFFHRSVTCSKNSQQMSSPHLMLNSSGRQGLHKSAVCSTNCSSTSLSPQVARLGCSKRPLLKAPNSLMCCVMSVARTAFTISLLAYSTQKGVIRKEKKRKDYAFRRQCNEKLLCQAAQGNVS